MERVVGASLFATCWLSYLIENAVTISQIFQMFVCAGVPVVPLVARGLEHVVDRLGVPGGGEGRGDVGHGGGDGGGQQETGQGHWTEDYHHIVRT